MAYTYPRLWRVSGNSSARWTLAQFDTGRFTCIVPLRPPQTALRRRVNLAGAKLDRR